MKKAIIGMIMSMVIVLGIGGFVTTINYYENRLAGADSKYRRDIDEVENLKDKEYDEMKSKYDETIYNIVNGENYEVTIEHNGKTVTYRQTDDDSKIGRLLNLKGLSPNKGSFLLPGRSYEIPF
jgi:archaellum component FlaF (FlaF/FlaG flagellin family)